MSALRKFFALFQKERLDAEMAEEMRAHLELQTERNRTAGMSVEEARYAARRQFGGEEQIKERCRDQRGWISLERTLKDFRHALRTLRRSPGFALTSIVTLALGIGLNTAMFSLANVLLLRPLPFDHPKSLVRLTRVTPQSEGDGFSPADFLELRRSGATFGQFAGYASESVSLSEPGRPAELHDAIRVSADYFDVLKIQPVLGRTFRAEDEILGKQRVVVLSEAIWRNRFGGDPAIIGRTIRIDGEPHEIVGILPAWAADDHLIRQTGLFRPLSFTDVERVSRDSRWVSILGRRVDALTAAQGEAFVAAVGARLAAEYPKANADSSWHSQELLGSTGHRSGRVIVAMLIGLSGFVLLIACSNLANFLLARSIARSHELAVRSALGASRLQLIRPLIIESLVLAGLGGSGALLVNRWAANWLSSQSIASGGAPIDFPLDWRVLGFAMGASLFAVVFCGVVPALFTMRVDVNHTIKRGARGVTASRGHQRLRHALVVGQFAMAMILLAGAGLLVRGAGNLLAQHLGWDSSQVVEGVIDLPVGKYSGDAQVLSFHRELLERLDSLPGVKAVCLSEALPYGGLPGPRAYRVEGRAQPVAGQELVASPNGITPAYFGVTGTRLLAGRTFTGRDTATSAKTVIVNESMARALFPNENPIGRRIARSDAEKPEWAEIVGVVSDIRTVSLYQRPSPFQVYYPLVQGPARFIRFAARLDGIAPESVIEPIRMAVAELDPDLPVRDLMSADALVTRSSSDVNMLKKMLSGFAVLGLALAALGIYGVIARTVAQRTGEIGIRMALGAQVTDVTAMVVRSGIRLAMFGAAIGFLGALALARLIRQIMPAIQVDGGLVLAGTTALLVLIALVVTWLPARRAAKVDPMVALRCE